MVVCIRSVLNVRTSDFEDLGYNLKRDGWLNSFTDVKNQTVRDDGMPWRGAREKRPEFFWIIFSALTDKADIILDWQFGVGLFFFSFCYMYLILVVFIPSLFVTFPYQFLVLISLYFVGLGGSIIACCSIQRHIAALKLDIDIFRSILLPFREPNQEHTSQPAPPQRGSVFAPPPRKMAKRNFDLLCE